MPLKPNQFDAPVSFLYTPAHGWPAVREAVDNGDREAAALAVKQTESGGKVIQALMDAGGKPPCC